MTAETSNARGPEYTTEMGEAADRYIRDLCVMADGAYALRPPTLPGTFRWEDLYNAMLAAAPPPAAACPNCDDTGDVTRADGEWRGVCTCPAGQPPAAARGDVLGLVAKWRERVPEGAGDSARVLMREHCADELESALAAEGVQAGEVEQQPEARGVVARTLDDWHEDNGPVVWWRIPVNEPAWIGTPNDSDWPGYHTHWTPHPEVPSALTGERNG